MLSEKEVRKRLEELREDLKTEQQEYEKESANEPTMKMRAKEELWDQHERIERMTAVIEELERVLGRGTRDDRAGRTYVLVKLSKRRYGVGRIQGTRRSLLRGEAFEDVVLETEPMAYERAKTELSRLIGELPPAMREAHLLKDEGESKK